MKKYLIRLDDACPTMDQTKWNRIEEILDCYLIYPMVGVIPYNEDPKQKIDTEEINFWDDNGTLKRWIEKEWTIALHGYNHCYTSNEGMLGINPIWRRSEFSGLPLDEQKIKIKKGVSILRKSGIDPLFFFAPSHTFDENTLIALREESNIKFISDTIATKPYTYKNFIFIPQIGGHCIDMRINGIWTFCLHPNSMDEIEFVKTEDFLKLHHNEFIKFQDLDLQNVKKKSALSHILSFVYFSYRKFRGIN